MKTTNLKNRWLLHLLSAAIMTIGLTACSGSDDKVDEPLKPDTPVKDGDWQDIPANGGTIEKGDIAITFPSGTFSSDTKVAISEVKKGQMAGANEASTFYQITMPCNATKPITVKVKSDEKDNNIRFVAFANAYGISSKSYSKAELQYETTYSNGEYSATIPAVNGDIDNDNVFFTVGLGRYNNTNSRTRGLLTEVLYEGKVGSISYQLRYPWSLFSHNRDTLNLITPISPRVNEYIKEAIKQITSLGFKVEGDKILYVDFELNEEDWGGHKVCGIPGETGYSMWVGLGAKKLLSATEDDIKFTVIHEILHWFQAFYDPRSNYKKSKKSYSGEELILYEAGAVWAEQFMNGGKLNGNFLKQYLPTYLRSIKDLDAVYPSNETQTNKYSNQGYGMSSMLYYFTSPISEMTAFGIDKTKIVDIYKKWAKTPGTTYWPIESWLDDHDSGFMYTTQFDEYILALLSGKLIDDVNVTNGYTDASYKYNINGPDKKEFTATCYRNGCVIHGFSFAKYINNEKTFKGKDVVIKQTEGKDVSTYIIAQNSSQFKILKKTISSNETLVISGDELNALFGEGKPIMLHAVTINHTSNKNDFAVSLELKEAEELDVKITKVTDIRFDGHLKVKEQPGGYENNSYFGYYFRYYDDSEITFTQSNDMIHLESSHYFLDKYENGESHENKLTISFDITGFTGNFSKCKVENLKFTDKAVLNYPIVDKTIDWTKNVEELKTLITDLPATDTGLYPGIQRYGQQGTYNLGNFTFSGKGKNAFIVKEYDHTQTWSYPDGKSTTETYIPLYTDEDEMKLFIEFEYTTKKK